MQKISIGDAELSVEVKGSGDPVLLVSGLGGRASFWSQQGDAFAEHFQVVTHDHRGTGSSTRSAITYSVPQMTADVLRLMDALSIPTAAIVGHSTGGAIAQNLALDHTDRVTCVVLSATWAGPSLYFESLFKLRAAILNESGPEDYLLDGILRAYPPSVLSHNPGILADNKEDRVAAFPGLEIENSRIKAVLAHDLRDRVQSIQVPTMVIGASDDQITPAPFFEELADKIPNAQKVILPFGGHFVPQVRAKEYNDAVLKFLTAVN